MKLKCGYDTLMDAMNAIKGVSEDSSNGDNERNVIFRVNGETKAIQIAAVSIRIDVVRVPMAAEVELGEGDALTDGYALLQVRSKVLGNILAAFKGLSRTTVEYVQFETKTSTDRFAKLTICEVDNETGKKHFSTWNIENVPFSKGILAKLGLTMPEEMLTIDTAAFLLYANSMLPFVKGQTNDYYTTITFTKDFVFSREPMCVAMMRNQLSSVLSDMAFHYRNIEFLKGAVGPDVLVQVGRTGNRLSFKVGDMELFMCVETNLIKNIEDSIKKYESVSLSDAFVKIDRLYFRDVLRRLALASDAVRVKLGADAKCIEVQYGDSFSQEIPVLESKGIDALAESLRKGIDFSVKPEVLPKLLIGADSVFSEDLYIYFTPTRRGDSIVLRFTDENENWKTFINVV